MTDLWKYALGGLIASLVCVLFSVSPSLAHGGHGHRVVAKPAAAAKAARTEQGRAVAKPRTVAAVIVAVSKLHAETARLPEEDALKAVPELGAEQLTLASMVAPKNAHQAAVMAVVAATSPTGSGCCVEGHGCCCQGAVSCAMGSCCGPGGVISVSGVPCLVGGAGFFSADELVARRESHYWSR